MPTIRLAEVVACLKTKGLKKVAVRVQLNARGALPLALSQIQSLALEISHLELTLISVKSSVCF